MSFEYNFNSNNSGVHAIQTYLLKPYSQQYSTNLNIFIKQNYIIYYCY